MVESDAVAYQLAAFSPLLVYKYIAQSNNNKFAVAVNNVQIPLFLGISNGVSVIEPNNIVPVNTMKNQSNRPPVTERLTTNGGMTEISIAMTNP